MDNKFESLDLSKLFGYESRIISLENEVDSLKRIIKKLSEEVEQCRGRRKKNAVVN